MVCGPDPAVAGRAVAAKRILLIDDDPVCVELVAGLLGAESFDVVCTYGGAQGLEAARSSRPDLIVCDIQMPDVDGLEVARRLRQDPSLATIALVALSANATTKDKDAAYAAGFDYHVGKSMSPGSLVALIAMVLERSSRLG